MPWVPVSPARPSTLRPERVAFDSSSRSMMALPSAVACWMSVRFPRTGSALLKEACSTSFCHERCVLVFLHREPE